MIHLISTAMCMFPAENNVYMNEYQTGLIYLQPAMLPYPEEIRPENEPIAECRMGHEGNTVDFSNRRMMDANRGSRSLRETANYHLTVLINEKETDSRDVIADSIRSMIEWETYRNEFIQLYTEVMEEKVRYDYFHGRRACSALFFLMMKIPEIPSISSYIVCEFFTTIWFITAKHMQMKFMTVHFHTVLSEKTTSRIKQWFGIVAARSEASTKKEIIEIMFQALYKLHSVVELTQERESLAITLFADLRHYRDYYIQGCIISTYLQLNIISSRKQTLLEKWHELDCVSQHALIVALEDILSIDGENADVVPLLSGLNPSAFLNIAESPMFETLLKMGYESLKKYDHVENNNFLRTSRNLTKASFLLKILGTVRRNTPAMDTAMKIVFAPTTLRFWILGRAVDMAGFDSDVLKVLSKHRNDNWFLLWFGDHLAKRIKDTCKITPEQLREGSRIGIKKGAVEKYYRSLTEFFEFVQNGLYLCLSETGCRDIISTYKALIEGSVFTNLVNAMFIEAHYKDKEAVGMVENLRFLTSSWRRDFLRCSTYFILWVQSREQEALYANSMNPVYSEYQSCSTTQDQEQHTSSTSS